MLFDVEIREGATVEGTLTDIQTEVSMYILYHWWYLKTMKDINQRFLTLKKHKKWKNCQLWDRFFPQL